MLLRIPGPLAFIHGHLFDGMYHIIEFRDAKALLVVTASRFPAIKLHRPTTSLSLGDLPLHRKSSEIHPGSIWCQREQCIQDN